MPIIDNQYFLPLDDNPNTRRTLADNIEMAWRRYTNQETCSDYERTAAQQFLIYAFNIKESNINEELIQGIMHKREAQRADDPRYEPGQGIKRLRFQFDNPLHLQRGYINEQAKKGVDYLSPQQRDTYRTFIHHGKFYQLGEEIDTAQYTSHLKKGYAAFTLNNDAELSVFPHSNKGPKGGFLMHSSMNAGGEVICAGELIIEQGKLKAINTYSGHYKPTLFHIYRALCHFANRGVDLNDVKIYTSNQPTLQGVTSTKEGEWYVTDATQLMTSMSKQLKSAAETIQQSIHSYQTSFIRNFLFKIKDFLKGSTLTHDRANIAKEVDTLMRAVPLSQDFYKNKQAVKQLKTQLKALKAKNNTLSDNHGKAYNSGRLNHQIDTAIKQLNELNNTNNLNTDQLQAMKNSF